MILCVENSTSSRDSHSHSRQESAGNIRDVVDAVLREDAEKDKLLRPSTPGTSRSRSGSESRPGSSASSQRRLSGSVWDNDQEKKNRDKVKKLFGHRLVPFGWK